MKNFIAIAETSRKELEALFAETDKIRDKTVAARGLTAALLFNMPSTRTLVSFEAALEQLGIASAHLNYVFSQMIRGEEMQDTARALSQYACATIARLNDHRLMAVLAEHSEVPVINAATPEEHPCQALADLYTLHRKKKLKGNMVIVGDPANNVTNSLLAGASLFGMKITLLVPRGYAPVEKYLARAKKNAEVTIAHEIACVKEADVIYATGWVRELPEQESPLHLKSFSAYQVDEAMLKQAPDDVAVMHPLPAFRGLEISNEVLDGKNSVVWEQSKNRLYVQKALLKTLLSL